MTAPHTQCQPEAAALRQHTPTPWYHRQAGETNRHGDHLDWIADSPEKGRHRKIIVGRDSCYSPADYAFIVEAVNRCAALKSQVEELTKALQDWQDSSEAYRLDCERAEARVEDLAKVAEMAKAAAEMELGMAASPDFSPRDMLYAACGALGLPLDKGNTP